MHNICQKKNCRGNRKIIATEINKPALAALPIATVATGIPLGICTIEYKESIPLIVDVFIGTPITGRLVNAATIPISIE